MNVQNFLKFHGPKNTFLGKTLKYGLIYLSEVFSSLSYILSAKRYIVGETQIARRGIVINPVGTWY